MTSHAVGSGSPAEGLDRAGQLRPDTDWLAKRWAAPESRVVRLVDDAIEIDPETESLALSAAREGEEFDAFLGLDGDIAYFATYRYTDDDVTVPAVSPLRAVLHGLSPRDLGLVLNAVGLAHWHRDHGFCANCGQATESMHAGHVRHCPNCGRDHYPRTDPAVIMLVQDDAGRALLGRPGKWKGPRFSTLAGFVEPGESAEAAVAREVFEEAGVVVDSVDFFASQPWPFPSSLMIAFNAHAASTEIDVSKDEELEEARWFTREGLVAEVKAGAVLIPPPASVARALIEHWVGQPLPVKPFM